MNTPLLRTDPVVGLHAEGHGPAVVLVHGSMSSKRQWRSLVEGLRGRYRTIAVDLHGYGDTPWPLHERPLTLADEAQLIDAAVRRVLPADEPFHLVGHSYGGVVALRLAQSQPQRLLSLTLYEPAAFQLLSPASTAHAEIDAVADQVTAAVARGEWTAATRCFVDYWNGDGSFEQLNPAQQQALVQQVPKVVFDFGAVAAEPCDAAALRAIDVPATVLIGRDGPAAAQRASAIVASLLPRAACHRVAAGHMGPLTHAVLVNPMIATSIDHAMLELVTSA